MKMCDTCHDYFLEDEMYISLETYQIMCYECRKRNMTTAKRDNRETIYKYYFDFKNLKAVNDCKPLEDF